jgi:hypothetical protein
MKHTSFVKRSALRSEMLNDVVLSVKETRVQLML